MGLTFKWRAPQTFQPRLLPRKPCWTNLWKQYLSRLSPLKKLLQWKHLTRHLCAPVRLGLLENHPNLACFPFLLHLNHLLGSLTSYPLTTSTFQTPPRTMKPLGHPSLQVCERRRESFHSGGTSSLCDDLRTLRPQDFRLTILWCQARPALSQPRLQLVRVWEVPFSNGKWRH